MKCSSEDHTNRCDKPYLSLFLLLFSVTLLGVGCDMLGGNIVFQSQKPASSGPTCKDEGDCPPHTPICDKSGAVPRCKAKCTGPGTCKPNFTCTAAYVCRKTCKDHTACADNEYCNGTYCLEGCRQPKIKSNCGDGEVCQKDHTCKKRCKEDSECSKDKTEICYLNACRTKCDRDDTCQDHEYCHFVREKRGFCETGCRINNCSKPGEFCTLPERECRKECTPNASPSGCTQGEEYCAEVGGRAVCRPGCEQTADCTTKGSDFVCSDHACRKECVDNQGCPGDQYCDTTAGVCKPGCRLDPTGDGCFELQVCSNQHQCVSKKECENVQCGGPPSGPLDACNDGICYPVCKTEDQVCGNECCGDLMTCDRSKTACVCQSGLDPCIKDDGSPFCCPTNSICINGGCAPIGDACDDAYPCPGEHQYCDESLKKCLDFDKFNTSSSSSPYGNGPICLHGYKNTGAAFYDVSGPYPSHDKQRYKQYVETVLDETTLTKSLQSLSPSISSIGDLTGVPTVGSLDSVTTPVVVTSKNSKKTYLGIVNSNRTGQIKKGLDLHPYYGDFVILTMEDGKVTNACTTYNKDNISKPNFKNVEGFFKFDDSGSPKRGLKIATGYAPTAAILPGDNTPTFFAVLLTVAEGQIGSASVRRPQGVISFNEECEVKGMWLLPDLYDLNSKGKISDDSPIKYVSIPDLDKGQYGWEYSTYNLRMNGALNLADLDSDGNLELIGLGMILDAKGLEPKMGTKKEVQSGKYSFGIKDYSYVKPRTPSGPVINPDFGIDMPVVVDFDGDGKLEIVDGIRIYGLNDQNEYEKIVLIKSSSSKLEEYLNVEPRGEPSSLLSAVAKYDSDSYIVSCGVGRVVVTKVYRDAKSGELKSEVVSHMMAGSSQGGPPVVGNFIKRLSTGPQFACVFENKLVLFEFERGIINKRAELSAPEIKDSSGFTGVAAFDFDGDGVTELVYQDEKYIRILKYDSSQLATLVQIDNSSMTLFGTPVVADVTGDHRANLVTISDKGFSRSSTSTEPPGVRIWSGKDNKWAPTRAFWNQQDYDIVNIDEDGTVPYGKNRRENWKTFNNYRQNVQSTPYLPQRAVELEWVGFVDESCDKEECKLRVKVKNKGSVPIPGGTVLGQVNVNGSKFKDLSFTAPIGANQSITRDYNIRNCKPTDRLDVVVSNEEGTCTAATSSFTIPNVRGQRAQITGIKVTTDSTCTVSSSSLSGTVSFTNNGAALNASASSPLKMFDLYVSINGGRYSYYGTLRLETNVQTSAKGSIGFSYPLKEKDRNKEFKFKVVPHNSYRSLDCSGGDMNEVEMNGVIKCSP